MDKLWIDTVDDQRAIDSSREISTGLLVYAVREKGDLWGQFMTYGPRLADSLPDICQEE